VQTNETARPNGSALSSAEIRERILASVMPLIAEHGIDGMTMRQVADVTGLSTGTINYHFSNKRGLVIAALERVYRIPDAVGSARGTAAERLRTLTRGFVLSQPRTRNWWRFWLDYTAHAARDGELRKHQLERFERQREYFAGVIADGISGGEFAKHIDAALAAETLLTLAYGLALRQTLEPDPRIARNARVVLDAHIEQMGLLANYVGE
jgi:AcrR family transcriptional regulator